MLFNLIGYKYVANYFDGKATRELQVLLDQNKFNEADLISFKLPLSLPYSINSKEFVSIQGNIDINGVNYQYVKKRIYNDTLEILCVPNVTKSLIKHTKDDFTKQLSDIANAGGSKKSPNNQVIKFSVSDFTEENHFNIYTCVYLSKLKHNSNHRMISSFDFLQSLEQPPEA